MEDPGWETKEVGVGKKVTLKASDASSWGYSLIQESET